MIFTIKQNSNFNPRKWTQNRLRTYAYGSEKNFFKIVIKNIFSHRSNYNIPIHKRISMANILQNSGFLPCPCLKDIVISLKNLISFSTWRLVAFCGRLTFIIIIENYSLFARNIHTYAL